MVRCHARAGFLPGSAQSCSDRHARGVQHGEDLHKHQLLIYARFSVAEHSHFPAQSALPHTAPRGRASSFSSPSCLTYPSEKLMYLSLPAIDGSWLSAPLGGAHHAQIKPNIPPAVMRRKRTPDVSLGHVSGPPQPCGGRSRPQPQHLHRVRGIIPKQPGNARRRLSPAQVYLAAGERSSRHQEPRWSFLALLPCTYLLFFII